jgi:GNAT superfamily N-acetyltransferase
LGLSGSRYEARLRFLNRNLRTISRLIVHPQFRGLGIGSALVRRICCDCDTRWVEAIARMGEVCSCFERGGMERCGEGYFLWERDGGTEGGWRVRR